MSKTVMAIIKQVCLVVRQEFRNIFYDEGVLLIMLFAPIIYATIYSLAYSTEVLRDVPIGVVDHSKSPSSRLLSSALDAGPNVVVAYEPTDMESAKRLFFSRKIYGVVYIPADYERRLLRGESATIAIYLDASYMLMYRQVFQDLAAVLTDLGAMVEMKRLMSHGVGEIQTASMVQPVAYQSHTLFNPYQGYGTFVMPPVLMLILQQTLLVGIGMIGGTWRERNLYRRLTPTVNHGMSTVALLLGKMLIYGVIYAVILFYLLYVHYRLFHYPMLGNVTTLVPFLALYIIACISMGIALSSLFRYRETSLMVLLWSSIPLLMLSGVSYPHEAMPPFMQYLSQIFPSTFGARGFVKIATEGADIYEVRREINYLIMLIIIYLPLSYVGLHMLVREYANPMS